jgi:hypothetical protein
MVLVAFSVNNTVFEYTTPDPASPVTAGDTIAGVVSVALVAVRVAPVIVGLVSVLFVRVCAPDSFTIGLAVPTDGYAISCLPVTSL